MDLGMDIIESLAHEISHDEERELLEVFAPLGVEALDPANFRALIRTSHLNNREDIRDTLTQKPDQYFDNIESIPDADMRDRIQEELGLGFPDNSLVRIYHSPEQMVCDATVLGYQRELGIDDYSDADGTSSDRSGIPRFMSPDQAASEIIRQRNELERASSQPYIRGKGSEGYLTFVNAEAVKDAVSELPGKKKQDTTSRLVDWNLAVGLVQTAQTYSTSFKAENLSGENINLNFFHNRAVNHDALEFYEDLRKGHARFATSQIFPNGITRRDLESPKLDEVARRYLGDQYSLESRIAEEFVGELYEIGGWDLANRPLSDQPESLDEMLHPEEYAEK